ncbi:hypothetical protein ACWD4X_17190 [Streptomyces termitum]
MSARTVRPLAAVSGLALAGLALAGGAPAAYAAPGDNGDVKIHKVGTPFGDQSDEPKVCAFYLAGFNFDTLQNVQWEIAPQPAKPGGAELSGRITLLSGTGHTAPLALPDGMYKLTWTFAGENGAGKHKVFRVDCPNGTTGGSTGGHGPHGPVGAGGGGAAQIAAEQDSSAFGIGAAVAAGLAGAAGVVLIRRSRRRTDGAA